MHGLEDMINKQHLNFGLNFERKFSLGETEKNTFLQALVEERASQKIESSNFGLDPPPSSNVTPSKHIVVIYLSIRAFYPYGR